MPGALSLSFPLPVHSRGAQARSIEKFTVIHELATGDRAERFKVKHVAREASIGYYGRCETSRPPDRSCTFCRTWELVIVMMLPCSCAMIYVHVVVACYRHACISRSSRVSTVHHRIRRMFAADPTNSFTMLDKMDTETPQHERGECRHPIRGGSGYLCSKFRKQSL